MAAEQPICKTCKHLRVKIKRDGNAYSVDSTFCALKMIPTKRESSCASHSIIKAE